jgi:hypothetical protein
MPKWEYCAIVGPSFAGTRFKPEFPSLWKFTPNGAEGFGIGKPEPDELAKRIAQLGEEGWEMVGCGSTGHASQAAQVLYFKRLKA